MKRLTPRKEIREKIIFSNDEQTQKVCQFAGDIEDIFEIMEKIETSGLCWIDDEENIYKENYENCSILYNPKENSIEIYDKYSSFRDGWKMSEYEVFWWIAKE